MGKKVLYLRCPVCGKLSRPTNFDDGFDSRHDLESATQESLSYPGHAGGDEKKGFEWTKQPISNSEKSMLVRLLETVLRRLHAFRPVDECVPQTEEEAELYVSEAEAALQEAQTELAFRKSEIKHLLG